jgi:hypothetical protein
MGYFSGEAVFTSNVDWICKHWPSYRYKFASTNALANSARRESKMSLCRAITYLKSRFSVKLDCFVEA